MTRAHRPALRFAIAATLCLLAGQAAGATEYVRADLRLSAPWARASASKTAEAFITIRNAGAMPERLVAISSPVAKRVELLRYEQIGGVNGSRVIKSIEIPPATTVSLAPARTVLSLVGLKRPLQPGATITLTLTFANAGAVSVFAKVAPAGTMEPPPDPADKKAPPKKAPPKRKRR